MTEFERELLGKIVDHLHLAAAGLGRRFDELVPVNGGGLIHARSSLAVSETQRRRMRTKSLRVRFATSSTSR